MVGTVAKIEPRQLSHLPRTIGEIHWIAMEVARQIAVEVAGGRVSEGANDHSRARDLTNSDRIPQRCQLGTEIASGGAEPIQIAHRGEPRLQHYPSVFCCINE